MAKKYYSKYFTNEEIDELLHSQNIGSVTFGADTEGDDSIMRVFSVGPEYDEEGNLIEDPEYRKKKWFEVRDSEDGFTEETEHIRQWCLGKWRVGKPYSLAVNLTTPDRMKIRLTDKNQYVRFTFQTKDAAGNDVNESVKITWQFSCNGVTQKRQTVATYGEEAYLKVDNFLVNGVNTITIIVNGAITGAEVMRSVTYEVVEMSLTSTFKVSQAQNGSTMIVPWALKSSTSDVKCVTFLVDGEQSGMVEYVTDYEGSGNKELDISGLTPGHHHLQIFAYIDDDSEQRFYSYTLYREFCIAGAVGNWVMVSLDLMPGTFITKDKVNLVIPAQQFIDNVVEWGFYSSEKGRIPVIWTLGGENLHTEEADVTEAEANGKTYRLVFQPETLGEVYLTANINGKQNSYRLLVKVNSSGVVKTLTNCVLDLSAKGRTNSEPVDERCQWKSNGFAAQFPPGWQWSDRQGWCDFTHEHRNTETNEVESRTDTALVVSGGKQVVIPIPAFGNQPHVYGMSIECDFEVVEIDDEDSTVFQCWGKNNGVDVGLKIKAGSVTAQSTNGNMFTTFASGERNHLCLSIFAADSPSMTNLAFLYLSGTYERCLPYSTARWTHDGKIVIGSAEGTATIRIYNLRVFQRALTVTEYLWNMAIDAGTVTETVSRNDIYENGAISVAKVQNKLSVVLVDGRDTAYNHIKTLEGTQSKSVKVRCDAEYISCERKERNFKWTNGIWWLQGTSSLRYPRKNFKTRTYKKGENIVCTDWEGKTITKGLVSVVDGDMPCNEIIFKADFMDSSCTRNATVARIVGDIEPLISTKGEDGQPVVLTPPQKAMSVWEKVCGRPFPYKIRTTPNAEAIMMFHRLPGDKQYICLGQYTMLNDKGNEELYGFKSIYAPTSSHMDDKDVQFVYEDPCCQTITDTLRKELLNAGKIYRVYDNEDTHCYEILDNNNSFAGFATIANWDKEAPRKEEDKYRHLMIESGFDSRYEEIDDKDYDTQAERTEKARKRFLPLVAFIWWLNNTKDMDAEIDQHIRLYNCADYKVYYDRFGAVDQIMKNMMWTTYGEHSKATPPASMPAELKPYFDLVWMPIVYDNDSTVDKRNTGSVFFDYEFDRNTLDAKSSGGYCYSGHDSNLWNFLEGSERFMEIYREQDAAYYTAGLTIENVLSYYDEKARDKWPEQAYNENMYYKYIAMVLGDGTEESKGWIDFLQGMDKSHMHWWLINRFAKIDADNGTGAFANRTFSFLAPGAPVNRKMYFRSAVTTKYAWRQDKATKPVDEEGHMSVSVSRGEEFSISTGNIVLSIGSPVYVLGANNLSEIDLHEYALYLASTFEMTNMFVDGVESNLRKLNLGVPDDVIEHFQNNSAGFSISSLEKANRLEELNIRGQMSLSDFSWLQRLTSLKVFRAYKTSMKEFRPANGTMFSLLELPEGLQGMVMSNCNWERLEYTPTKELNTINLSYMNDQAEFPLVKVFVFAWLDMLEATYGMGQKWSDYTLILSGVDWLNVPYHRLEQLMNLGVCRLTGHSYIKCSEEYSSNQMSDLMAAFGENIFRKGADLILDCDSNVLTLGVVGIDGTNVTTDSNGKPQFLCGGKIRVVATGFPVRSEDAGGEIQYSFRSGTSPYECTINGSTGEVQTTELGYTTEHDITVYAYDTARLISGYVVIRVLPLTYPSEVVFDEVRDGNGNVVTPDANGVYNITNGGQKYTFHRKYEPTPNGSVRSEEWEYSGADVGMARQDPSTTHDTFVLATGDITPAEVNETLTYRANFPFSSDIKGKTISRTAKLSFFTIGDVLINLRNDAVSGNPELYGVLVPAYVAEPQTTNRLNSLELKNIFGKVVIPPEANVSDFYSMTFNVLDYLQNVRVLEISGCTNIETMNASKMNHLEQLGASNLHKTLEILADNNNVIKVSGKDSASVFVSDSKAEASRAVSDAEAVEYASDFGGVFLEWPNGTRVRYGNERLVCINNE